MDKVAQALAHEIFDPIAARFLAKDGVDIGAMFGSEGLRIRTKVFALVDYEGDLMLKVPEARADELVDDGIATRVAMRGRVMREWLTVSRQRAEAWDGLIGEAYAYVDALTP